MHPLENDLNLIKSSTLIASIFDILGLNYSVIDVRGDYIVQNNLSVSSISSSHMKATEIDPVTWEDCRKVMMKRERTVIESNSTIDITFRLRNLYTITHIVVWVF